jgi:hypothetical protein
LLNLKGNFKRAFPTGCLVHAHKRRQELENPREKDKRRQELENPREKASPFPPDKKKNEKYSKKRPALSIT